MRLATWNVNSVQARLPRLLSWLEDTGPDVVCLQETKAPDAGFPVAEVGELGYEAALVRRRPMERGGHPVPGRARRTSPRFPGEPGFPEPGGPRHRPPPARAAGSGRSTSPTAGALDDAHYAYKLSWLAALRDALAAELGRPRPAPLAVCGDFNIAPTDDDVWDPAAFVGSTHVTAGGTRGPGRPAATSGSPTSVPAALKDASPSPTGTTGPACSTRAWACASTWCWPAPPVAAAVKDAYIDREARKGKGPSDHAPIVVDLDLPAAG